MMIFFFVIGAIAGILLGLRFKVFVLVPATLLVAAVVVAGGNQPAVMIALTAVGTVALLQIGYLVGCTARSLLHKRTMEHCDHSIFNVNRALK